MKLSIIIPVYNEAPYLKRCLDSIEPHDDVEVIIIDDGSTDGSSGVCDRYAKNCTVIHHQYNWGVSMSRNHGIANATGDYITFLDSDDEYRDGAIDSMLEEIKRRDDNIIQFNHSRERWTNISGYYTTDRLPQKWVLVWNKAYKREFIIKNHITFTDQVTFEEDRLFNLKCFIYENRIYHSPYCTVIKHFDNEKSICHSVSAEQMITLTNALTGRLAEKPPRDVRRIIRKCLTELWDSKNAHNLFD